MHGIMQLLCNCNAMQYNALQLEMIGHRLTTEMMRRDEMRQDKLD